MKSLLLLLFASVFAVAQSQLGSGAISGRVTDPSGRAVANASVAILNPASGFNRATLTNQQGDFSAPVLPPGSYTVRAEAEGFRALEQTGVLVSVGATATLRLELTLGSISEVVTVEEIGRAHV